MQSIALLQIGSDPVSEYEHNAEVAKICAQTRALYSRSGFKPPWLGYLAVQDGVCVGTCGFTAEPRSGEVEIAYYTFPEFEGRGIATAMAARLVALAQDADPSLTVVAYTLPVANASNSILKKLGFVLAGEAEDHEVGRVWAWRRAPA